MTSYRPWTSDQQRILSVIAMYADHDPLSYDRGGDHPRSGWWSYDGATPVIGDIVRGMTGAIRCDRFVIGRVVEVGRDGFGLRLRLREIGGRDTCWVGNELWHVLRHVPAELLLEGQQWAAREKARRVVGRLTRRYWVPRWGGIAFEDDATRLGRVRVRRVFGEMLSHGGPTVVEAPIEFQPRVTLRAIEAQLRAVIPPEWLQ
jgi:hypothetical protein